MNRKNFVNAVAEKNPTVTKKTVAAITASVLETIQEAVVAGEAVQFQGFGTFKAVERAERTGHNPQTGESTEVCSRQELQRDCQGLIDSSRFNKY